MYICKVVMTPCRHMAAHKSIPIGKRPEGAYARIFREEIERIGELPDPEYKTGLLTENAISVYL
jgi:hypothetical protein